MMRLGFVTKTVFFLCVGVMTVLIAANLFFPKAYEKMMPYRFYHVLTSSMEPLITTDSLVCVRKYESDMVLKENDIITFYAERFGERIIITHRFSRTEINEEGTVIYRTHPEQSDAVDAYETTGDDILGIYLFHIPYAGKLILFIRSVFGFLWICQVTVILLVKELIAARWLEKEPVCDIDR